MYNNNNIDQELDSDDESFDSDSDKISDWKMEQIELNRDSDKGNDVSVVDDGRGSLESRSTLKARLRQLEADKLKKEQAIGRIISLESKLKERDEDLEEKCNEMDKLKKEQSKNKIIIVNATQRLDQFTKEIKNLRKDFDRVN